MGVAAGDEESALSFDHDDQRIVRQVDLHEPVSAGEHRGGDVQFEHRRFDLVGQFDTELFFLLCDDLAQAEQQRRIVDRRALDQQRKDRDEEDDIEDQVRMVDARQQRIGGENDRHGSAQPDPRNVDFGLAAHLAERQQAEPDAEGACQQDHRTAYE